MPGIAALAILVAGGLAFANSFSGVFLFDDPLLINRDLAGGPASVWSCLSGTRSLVHD